MFYHRQKEINSINEELKHQNRKIIIYGKNSIIVSIGKDNFYESYIRESITTYISHRFEDIVRKYFSNSLKKINYKE